MTKYCHIQPYKIIRTIYHHYHCISPLLVYGPSTKDLQESSVMCHLFNSTPEVAHFCGVSLKVGDVASSWPSSLHIISLRTEDLTSLTELTKCSLLGVSVASFVTFQHKDYYKD